jgi:S1-C subfamily serine protease
MRVVSPPIQGQADLGIIKMIKIDPDNPPRADGRPVRRARGQAVRRRRRARLARGRAGFQAGDVLLSIGGQKVSGDPKEAAALLRANPGTEVVVVLQSPGQGPREARIKRTVP